MAEATVHVESSQASRHCIDPSNPLFVHSSDIPGVSLVHMPFTGTGFGGWRRSVIVSLSARNKIGFIDGSCPRPPSDSPHVQQWDRCNNIVISWLTNSLSPEIAESVQYSETAEEIWGQLNRRYGTVNGTKVFELKKALASTVQGSLDIASYFNKLQKLWDELRVMRVKKVNTCICAAKAELQKEDEENKLYQFLMGLNETYVGVRSNILIMNPLPSLDTAYNILLQDENQRQIMPNTHLNPEAASFNVNSNSNNKNINKNFHNNKNFNFTPGNHKQNHQRTSFESTKSNVFCRYCKKDGHWIEECPKLHGPNSNTNYRSYNSKGNRNNNYYNNKGKGSAAAVTAEHVYNGVEHDSTASANSGNENQQSSLSLQGLAQQLVNLLQQSQVMASNAQPNLMGSANFAGPFSEEATGDW